MLTVICVFSERLIRLLPASAQLLIARVGLGLDLVEALRGPEDRPTATAPSIHLSLMKSLSTGGDNTSYRARTRYQRG